MISISILYSFLCRFTDWSDFYGDRGPEAYRGHPQYNGMSVYELYKSFIFSLVLVFELFK